MNKFTIALAAVIALSAGSTAMAKAYHTSKSDTYGVQRHAGSIIKSGEQAYGRAFDAGVVIRDGQNAGSDPDARIRAQLLHEPSPADF